jgi:hypothetical protein
MGETDRLYISLLSLGTYHFPSLFCSWPHSYSYPSCCCTRKIVESRGKKLFSWFCYDYSPFSFSRLFLAAFLLLSFILLHATNQALQSEKLEHF